ALPFVPRQLNRSALHSYLAYEYVPAPESIFCGIRKLPAGHSLEIRLDGSTQGCLTTDWRPYEYWNVQFLTPETKLRSVDEYAQELRTLLRAAVARRLISD